MPVSPRLTQQSIASAVPPHAVPRSAAVTKNVSYRTINEPRTSGFPRDCPRKLLFSLTRWLCDIAVD